MKKKFILLFIGILLSFLFQYMHLFKKLNDLKQINENLIKVTQLQKEDLIKVLQTNIDFVIFENELMLFNSDSVYLFVDYPLCYACFNGVVHFLSDYSNSKNLNLTIRCDEFYIPMIKKKLLFDEIENVEVNKIINVKQFSTKMTIVFKSESQNYFYLPLPENREMDFLEAFFKL